MTAVETDPLEQPGSASEVLRVFLDRFPIDPRLPPADLLRQVASAFSGIPYENLTKIIKEDREGAAERARRAPLEVISDHLSRGAGGTCFSLTAALLHLLRALGFAAEPVLADRSYGPNTHCALWVWVDGRPCLLDPGFLIVEPVALPRDGPVRLSTPFNEVILKPRRGGGGVELHTVQEGRTVHRLTFKAGPADRGEFLKAWEESFDWDMMNYPLLTRVRGGAQLYLHERRLLVRRREGVKVIEIAPEELPARIAEEFGLDPAIPARALEILGRKSCPRPPNR